MCGGFAVAASDRATHGLAWHLGRLTTYGVLGAVVGGLGAQIPGPTWVPAAVAAVWMVWFAGRLAGVFPEPHLRLPSALSWVARWIRRPGLAARWTFGMATGLLPCGLVYAALGMAVGSGGAAAGALTMLCFGLGTLPLLGAAATGLRVSMQRRPALRIGLAAAVLVSGLWSVASRAMMEAEAPDCHETASVVPSPASGGAVEHP